MNKFKNIVIILFFLSSCKSDLDMGMEYQKVLLAKKGNDSIYCYRLVWALDAEAYFISSNKDVCMGFDSTKDYCFGKGNQLIYYKLENDTLKIYSYGSRPTIPKATVRDIDLVNLEYLSLDKYEDKYKRKEIEKVVFDSLHKMPCTPVAPPIDLRNIKFKSD